MFHVVDSTARRMLSGKRIDSTAAVISSNQILPNDIEEVIVLCCASGAKNDISDCFEAFSSVVSVHAARSDHIL